jgi:hypothetical protein
MMKSTLDSGSRNRPPRLPAPQKQKGLGMLEVLLFVAILGGLAVTGYLEWRARETVKTARQERQSLAQADTALTTFATIHFRLPCPDTDRDGLEDCGAAQKGWLPSTTLQLAGADPGVGIGQLRYLVQRGATAYDLANPTAGDDWRPLEYGGFPPTFDAMRATGAAPAYQANILTLADMCQRLEVGSAAALTSGMAQVSSSPARAVAYALVHPGLADTSGNGSLFEGVNATNAGNAFEDPAKTPSLSSYDDRVLERSFSSLYAAFDCQPLFQSINTVALGMDVVTQVDDMRQDSIAAAQAGVAIGTVMVAITGLALVKAIMATGSDTGNAIADGVVCGASLGFAVNACVATGLHVGAAIAGAITTVANTTNILANSHYVGLAAAAWIVADQTADAAAATQSCNPLTIADSLAKSKAQWDEAVANREKLLADLAVKRNELNLANAAKATSITNWQKAVRYYGVGDQSAIDYRITNLYNAANDWYPKDQINDFASAQVTDYQEAVNNAADQLSDYDNKLATRAVLTAVLRSEITVLEGQIAAEADPAAREALQLTLAEKKGDLSFLTTINPDTGLLVLQEQRNRAAADLATARSDLTAAIADSVTAQSALTTSANNYRARYSQMIDATFGPYEIQRLNPTPIFRFVACTERTITSTACVPADGDTRPVIQTRDQVISAVWDLFGLGLDIGAAQPHDYSKFMRPIAIQREIDALQQQVDDAIQIVSDTRGRYDQLLSLTSSPPTCTVTGTGVTPWLPATAAGLLLNVDAKGATR